MFAALTFDRDPLTLGWDTFLSSLNSWVQIAGAFAAAAIVLFLISRLASGNRSGGGRVRTPFLAGALLAALGYFGLLALYLPDLIAWLSSEGGAPIRVPAWRVTAQNVLWTVAGAAALFAVLVPILADLPLLSMRRIGALARLSFKEAVRRKILWVFMALILIVLFGSWFLPAKYEDQVRNYVQVVSLAEALMLIIAALLLASFGIPDDIRHQTIHTVLTKPVQRFEIFLGRFLGYVALMTMVLFVISAVGLLYVLRGVSEEAAEESLKAREPVYGQLEFEGTKERDKGENVGREWEYRSYIFGPVPNAPPQYAVWNFTDLPSSLGRRDKVRAEFSFDIYRTTKGKEGEGVLCTFLVESKNFDASNPALKTRYDEKRKQLQKEGKLPDEIDRTLAEEFGYYEIRTKEVKDYHTQFIDFPGGIIANALKAADAPRKDAGKGSAADPAPALLRIKVRCESRTQFVGMAKYDLYLRRDAASGGGDRLMFCLNYFKGGFGLWLRLCLVVGLAVALSTYLSGVITLLATAILYVLGFFRDFIEEVASRRVVGGGPIEAAYRLVRKPGGESIAVPLEETTAVRVSTGFDRVFSVSLRGVLNLVPDVDRFNFTDFVAEGVSIGPGQMAYGFLLLVGFLLPWAVLAYYLLRWREVASST